MWQRLEPLLGENAESLRCSQNDEAPLQDMLSPLSLEAIRLEPSLGGHNFFLPIEFFKSFPESLFTGEEHHCFLSSGTTKSSRSQSKFSQKGLSLYRLGALSYFYQVLSRFFPDYFSTVGYSLVPPVNHWTDSSLAQMIGWIGEETPVRYIEGEENPLAKLTEGAKAAEPLWVFGTGFHYVDLYDRGIKCPLPKGSIVIETGGTKGRTRSVSRQELYHMICEVFSVTPNSIVGEYGMCEMASQAYDWVEPTTEAIIPLEERRYLFPSWVKTYVRDGGVDAMKSSGFGALTIVDPLRVDYPWPLRTQDMVHLDKDGGFCLEGRVPYAVLKGCSLNVEEVASPSAARSLPPYENKADPEPLSYDEIMARGVWYREFLRDLFRQSWFIEVLAQELGSEALAVSALEDVEAGLPVAGDQWVQVCQKSLACQASRSGGLLTILPSSHSVAAFYPVGVAFVAGVSQWVRGSDTKGADYRFLQMLAKHPEAGLKVVGPDFRLGPTPIPKSVAGVLCFGEDHTIQEIRRISGLPTQGFGSALSGVVVSQKEVFDSLDAIIKDCFSLAQRGCMSGRFLVVYGQGLSVPECEELSGALTTASHRFLAGAPAPDLCVALDHEYLRQSVEGALVFPRSEKNSPVFPIWQVTASQLLGEILRRLSARPFVLPVFVVPTTSFESLGFSHDHHSITQLSLSHVSDVPGVQRVCGLGAANAPKWDGFHMGSPLFKMT